MNHMLLSVIVPVYNGEKTLPDLIKPLLKIECQEIEIIIVDDGSKDNSYNLCKAFAAQDARVKALHIENSGVSAARNKGIQNASGKYIYFCDCDDLVFTETLISIIPLLKENNYDMVMTDYVYMFSDKGKTVRPLIRVTPNKLLSKSEIAEQIITPLILKTSTDMASLWHKFFAASIIKDNHLFFNTKVHRGEDWQFILGFLRLSQSAYYLPEVLYEYRIESSQTESKYKKEPGIHLLYSPGIKLELAKEFNIKVDEDTYILWCTDIFIELIFSANSDISYGEWRKIAGDRLVLMAAKKLFSLKSEDYFKYEISRKYKIYSLLVILNSKRLLRFLINKNTICRRKKCKNNGRR